MKKVLVQKAFDKFKPESDEYGHKERKKDFQRILKIGDSL